jgi:aminoglycoside phosphotransferase (APT) family kinase protein
LTRVVEGFPPDPQLSRWIDDAGVLPGTGRVEIDRLPGGSQNELFVMRRGETKVVLRTPPLTAAPDRVATMRREFRLLRALAGTDVPHARLLAADETGRITGQPFYVMEAVEGWSPYSHGWVPPFDRDDVARTSLARALVDGAARLALVDWQTAGLEDFGRPEGFHDRQVDRWLAFLARFQYRELPGLDEAAEWLRRHRPASWTPGIIHGDFQFANVMFAHATPARLVAVIDWEMATIGDPLLDLAWALIAWPPEGDDMVHIRSSGGWPPNYAGMPSRDELLEQYASMTGRPVDDIDYYVVLARFKLGVVLEKTAARAEAGEETRVDFGPVVLELIRKAAELARSL